MFSLEQFAYLAAVISAMIDVLTIGRESYESYFAKRRTSPDYIQKGEILRDAYQTYSDAELEAIKIRIEGCRERFVKEGAGELRKICFCSVLSDVKVGNGGDIPDPEWEKVYAQLKCAEVPTGPVPV